MLDVLGDMLDGAIPARVRPTIHDDDYDNRCTSEPNMRNQQRDYDATRYNAVTRRLQSMDECILSCVESEV